MMTAHLAWLFDPAIPPPMIMLVLIAAVGNGIQHGSATFRSILKLTAILGPLVILARAQLMGFHFTAWRLCCYLFFFWFTDISSLSGLTEFSLPRKPVPHNLNWTIISCSSWGWPFKTARSAIGTSLTATARAVVLIEDNMLISLVNEKFMELTKYTKTNCTTKNGCLI
ncbi:MAG: hypothetical protein R2874_04485 [Desulfobacterales bacterium]